jgi:hypothetical protein
MLGGSNMQSMSNSEIIELLISLTDRYDAYSVKELISELEVDEDFLENA